MNRPSNHVVWIGPKTTETGILDELKKNYGGMVYFEPEMNGNSIYVKSIDREQADREFAHVVYGFINGWFYANKLPYQGDSMNE